MLANSAGDIGSAENCVDITLAEYSTVVIVPSSAWDNDLPWLHCSQVLTIIQLERFSPEHIYTHMNRINVCLGNYLCMFWPKGSVSANVT